MVAIDEGRNRVVIRGVSPEIDAGRHPIKRTPGEVVTVEADVFTDGHDEISCDVLWRRADGRGNRADGRGNRADGRGNRADGRGDSDETEWREEPMGFLVNDRWAGSFEVGEVGSRYVYTVRGWVDRFKTWQHDLQKRVDADQDVSIDLMIGAELVEEAAASAPDGADADRLEAYVKLLRGEASMQERARGALTEELLALVRRHGQRRFITTYPRELEVVVDRERARFSTWYELFPRSASPQPGEHGTIRDVIDHRLDYVEGMGFDVLYLPPVHPIGETARKGRDNVPTAEEGDVGSPWAIGSSDGGHKSVHPQLGTVEDVRDLAEACSARGIDLALDIAFQCSPDHPYVTEHPEWFAHRPDGTIQYAENPPKKYQDIYPFDFETEDWQALWTELKSVFEFWIDVGVRIFRVDNPHTKPFPFWEWLIGEIHEEHPGVIFLAEAFTRPRVMEQLAKLGFDQSYTYFAWRNDKHGLTEYLTELTQTEMVDYYRPNAWPNTPDILTEFLQHGGRPAFVQRLLLAATLTASYGIYGPAFELQENRAARPGSEEYEASEKYEIRDWDLDRQDSLHDLIVRVNAVRQAHPALQFNRRLRFHHVDNDQLLCYSKSTPDHDDVVLCVVNLDPHWTQGGWVHLDLAELGLEPGQQFQVHDLITGARYRWQDPANFVELNPGVISGHVFEVLTQERTERDFATYR